MSADPSGNKVYYQCQRCTNCCRWPGFVRLTDQDVSRISRFLEMTEFDFVQQYTVLRPHRSGLALKARTHGHDCIFLDGQDCAIQPVKPSQCAGFPNTWNFPGWQDECQAIPVVSGMEPEKDG